MNEFWTLAGGWAAHAAWAGGVVLLLGWLGMRWLTGPARRHQVAALAVRGAVLTLGLCALPAWLLLPLPEWARAKPAEVAQSTRVEVKVTESVAEPKSAPDPQQPVELTPLQVERERQWVFVVPGRQPLDEPAMPPVRVDAGGVDAAVPEVAPERAVTAPAPAVPDLAPVPAITEVATPTPVPAAAEPDLAGRVVPLVLTAYFLVAGVLLAQLLLGHAVLVGLRWSAVPITGKARWVFDRLTDGGTARPRVLVSERVPSPVCFGLLTPTVLLPKALTESAGENELRWVLAHELDHIRRGDHRTAHWVGVARAAFFFVPWFWAVRRELMLTQEYLADAAAAEAGGQPVDYAAFLVDLSATPTERRLARPSLASAGVRAGKSDLFRRVNMLLKWGSHLERRAPRGFAVVAGSGLLAAAVGLSAVGVAADLPAKGEHPAPPTSVDVPVNPPVDPPPPPTPPLKAEEVKELKGKIEKAIKEGKADEARKLLDKLEKATVQPVPPVPALAPIAPAAPLGRVAPPAIPLPPRGDWAIADGRVGQNGLFVPGGNELRKQYEKQLKDFDKAIKDAKDDDAREQLAKARDEYKKAMDEAVKKADAARGDVDKAREDLNRAMERNRLEAGRGHEQLMQVQRQLQERLMKDLPKEFERLLLDPNLMGGGIAVFDGNGFQFPQGGQWQGFQPFNVAGGGRVIVQPRLGVRVDKVPAVLVEQLDLPKDSGVVVVEVVSGTPAEKAGLKKSDILLRLADKDVPTDPEAFTALVGKVKGGEKVEAVVIRKGKKETVKGIEMTDPKRPPVPPAPGGFSQISISVNDDSATISATQEGVSYAIAGGFENGKLSPNKITITEGKESKTYDSVDKVPDQYRGSVEKLIGRVRGLGR